MFFYLCFSKKKRSYAAFGIFLFMETIYRFLPPTFALVLFLFFSFLYIYQSTTTKFYLNLSSKRETASLTFGTGTLYARISRERKGKCAARRHTVRAHLGTNQPKSCADSNRSASQFVRYALLARARPPLRSRSAWALASGKSTREEAL